MRARLVLVLGLLILAGCAKRGAMLSMEPCVLNSIPVVPLVTSRGVSTAWLSEDSKLVTTSHGIPRGQFNGRAEVYWMSTTYQVVASGDELKRTWDTWYPTTATTWQEQDWAILSLSPALSSQSIFSDHATVIGSSQVPVIGEQLILVGYTREGGVLERYWVQVEVIQAPREFRKHEDERHIWFRTVNGKKLRQGFSGAPLLRRRSDGIFEACAMMVSAETRGGKPLDVGVAICVPGL